MKRTTLLLTLVVLLVLASSALAMESTNYKLTWFTLMTGSGGKTDYADYAADFTVGQTIIGSASSDSYKACLGYWCRTAGEFKIYLPLVLRNV